MNRMHFPPPFTGEVLSEAKRKGASRPAPSFLHRCAMQFTSPVTTGE